LAAIFTGRYLKIKRTEQDREDMQVAGGRSGTRRKEDQWYGDTTLINNIRRQHQTHSNQPV
jgi:hypothetical protein